MKTKQPWTLDEKAMVWVPTLLILGAALYSWSAARTRTIVIDDAITYASSEPRTIVYGAQFSPDGERLLVNYDGQSGGRAAVFDLHSLDRAFNLEVPPVPNPKLAVAASLADVTWAPDGQRIAGLFSDGSGTAKIKTSYAGLGYRFNNQPRLGLWNGASGKFAANLPYVAVSYDCDATLRYSPDGQTLVGEGLPPALFRATTGAPLRSFASGKNYGQFSPDATLIAMRAQPDDRKQATPLEVRDVATNGVLWRAKIKRSFLSWSAKDVLLASDYRALDDRRLLLWDGKTRRSLPAPPGQNIETAALHPSHPWVAICNLRTTRATKGSERKVESSELAVWNYATQKWMWRRPMSDWFDLDWSRDGRLLSAVENRGDGGNTRLWVFDAAGAVRHRSRRGNSRALDWSPDGKTLALANSNGVDLISVE